MLQLCLCENLHFEPRGSRKGLIYIDASINDRTILVLHGFSMLGITAGVAETSYYFVFMKTEITFVENLDSFRYLYR